MTAAFPEFDPDFASPSDWAAMYRLDGLQIVPAKMPVNGSQWKMPALTGWAEFQENLIPDAVFLRWYGQGGEHLARQNMGILTGRCSGNVFVLDLDVHKHPEAGEWWRGALAIHNSEIEPETVQQRTGGGGRQLLFRAPADWVAPTNRTNIGVDIRGQGGFAMMPPSQHESGSFYAWETGSAPWEIEIAVAPEWLLEAIETLIARHGSRPKGVKTASPDTDKDAFGRVVNGRESFMRNEVWHAVLELRRAAPIMSPAFSDTCRDEAWASYERSVVSRLEPRHDAQGRKQGNAELLELEHRGYSAFCNKWRRAIGKWDNPEFIEAAAKPKPEPGPELDKSGPVNSGISVPPGKLIKTDLEFVSDLVPPDYLVDGLVQKGFLYAITGPTGHGKTPSTMLMGARVARGLQYHGRDTMQGGVLFLAGENPTDIKARYVVMADKEGFEIGSIPFHFLEGVVPLEACMDRIREEAASIPNLSLVLVDTDQAYFMGEEGNSNEQRKWFAQTLRKLLKLSGCPTVIVNCHPAKNAGPESLVPIGGSSFLNEIDGNITCWADDKVCTLRPHPTKWRGVPFESLSFELKTVFSPNLVDSKGRELPSVMAFPISDEAAERQAEVLVDDDKIVLRLLSADKKASMASIAMRAMWTLNGKPYKSKVARAVARLLKSRMIYAYHGGKYRVTKKGAKFADIPWSKKQDEDDEE